MSETEGKSSTGIISSLSIVMFIQFFIWGSWYTSVSLFMSEQGMQDDIYWVFTAGPLGAILAPFIIGLIADRYFNTEKILSFCFIVSAISMMALPQLAGPGKSSVVNACIMIHMLFYMPTLGLTASLAFTHLTDGEKQFPIVRVFGTIGWIAAGLLISYLNAETTATQFYVAGGAALLLGIYCLMLPKTPAPKKGQKADIKDLLFWDAWKQFKNVSFLVFIVCSFLICIPLAAYYAYLQQQMAAMEIKNVAAVKTLGQGSEIIFMILMPFFFRKLGVKWMIVVGVLAWVLRYALFALGASENMVALVYAGIILHGICYDFFFVTGQIYVDKSTGEDVRGQTQAMNIFFTQGLGMYVGAIVSGMLFNKYFQGKSSTDPAHLSSWPCFWWPLCIMAAVVMVIFIVAFKHKDKDKDFSH